MLLVWKHELKIICIDIGTWSSLSRDDNLTNWLYVEYRISFKILFNLIKKCKIVGYWIFLSVLRLWADQQAHLWICGTCLGWPKGSPGPTGPTSRPKRSLGYALIHRLSYILHKLSAQNQPKAIHAKRNTNIYHIECLQSVVNFGKKLPFLLEG